jgi:hypothetical protein
MNQDQEKCNSCGAVTLRGSGLVHEYMTSSSGCWEQFGLVLAREYSDPAFMKIHRVTVDTYAAQHGGGDPRAIQSVNVHLVALYLIHEINMSLDLIPGVMEKVIIKYKTTFKQLEPPTYEITANAAEILKAKSAEEHSKYVMNWSKSVWRSWSGQHKWIRELVESIL